MKKTLTYLLVVVALVALASSASAITCTIDQRPAATLLIPYFQVQLNPATGAEVTDSSRTDTLITVVNASSQATLAHVVIWNRRSVPILDFNIALTAFDVVNWSMADVLTGTLPSTPSPNSASSGLSGSDLAGATDRDACQRNPLATVYPDFDGFLRFRPGTAATSQDNSQATTQYNTPAFGSSFAQVLWSMLDYDNADAVDCHNPNETNSDAFPITGPSTPYPASNGNLSGYVTIDMANYCSLSNPSFGAYWIDDAAGWENNLWGDYIIVSNSGIPTLGAPAVAIEAALDTAIVRGDGDPIDIGFDQPFNHSVLNGTESSGPVTRTFYARYWEDPDTGNVVDTGGISNGSGATSEQAYMALVFPHVTHTYGDQREPLGLRYGARYLNSGGLSSDFRVWRASQNPASGDELPDLTGPSASPCTDTEVNVLAAIYDEDENTIAINGCPSPCPVTTINFPYETQREDAGAIVNLTQNGWIYVNFLGVESQTDSDSDFDQAWMDYEMNAGLAFVNASVSAVALDPSTCNPVGLDPNDELADPSVPPDFAWPVGLGHP